VRKFAAVEHADDEDVLLYHFEVDCGPALESNGSDSRAQFVTLGPSVRRKSQGVTRFGKPSDKPFCISWIEPFGEIVFNLLQLPLGSFGKRNLVRH
jgi:hypothetical protein